MGLNLQSEEFWELRPDNFILMYTGYRTRQQQDYFPLRRLMAICFAAAGGSLTEEKILPLPLIDGATVEVKKVPKALTKEQIEIAEAKHKARQERLKLKRLNGDNS